MTPPDLTPRDLIARRRAKRDRTFVVAVATVAAVLAGAAVIAGVLDAHASWKRAESISTRAQRDAHNAEAILDQTRIRLRDALGRGAAIDRSRAGADWGRLLTFVAQSAHGRCEFSQFDATDRGERDGPARLDASILGTTRDRHALLEMIGELESAGAFDQVRLARYAEGEGAFELRLRIEREGGEP